MLNFLKKFNKYIITLIVFGVIFLFIGEQSVIKGIRRAHQIHNAEKQLKSIRKEIQDCEQQAENLQNTDSLERFAREQYYMHAPNEDVYLIHE